MADDSSAGERTEEATPKKRKDARERGQVLKSNELVMVGSMLIMFAALRGLMPMIAENLFSFAGEYLSGTHMTMEQMEIGSFLPIANNMAVGLLTILLPILAVALVAAVLINVIQTGFLFSTKAMEPKMSRLNPVEGFKRIFSMRGVFELLKSLLKVAVIGLVVYQEITNNLEVFPTLMNVGVHAAVLQIADMIVNAAFKVLAFLAIIAAVDYMFQRRKYEKDLMMSKYEVKMEMKQQEGDPQIKGKIKQKQREMAMMRMMSSVPDADVVITNPTEYAVALRYDEAVADAPRVVAKGKNLIAAKIKEIAQEHNVEIMEDKPLARSLYAYCEIGDFIPVELYQAVAEILAQVYRRKRADRYNR
ncbi:MAG: flagellar biosynthesis protein FlhB [Christensenellaceae bacterium]